MYGMAAPMRPHGSVCVPPHRAHSLPMPHIRILPASCCSALDHVCCNAVSYRHRNWFPACARTPHACMSPGCWRASLQYVASFDFINHVFTTWLVCLWESNAQMKDVVLNVSIAGCPLGGLRSPLNRVSCKLCKKKTLNRAMR